MLLVSPLDIAAPVPCALWRVDLDQPVDAAEQATLSAGERARAGRFVFAHDRHRHVVAHAALRRLLAGSADEPERLRFVVGAHGKPALAGAAGPHFNLSHSHDIALVAVSDGAEVGVDVERLRPLPDAAALAAACFTPAERRALSMSHDSGGDAARDRAFLSCWTRKEACLKALGLGLALAPDGVEVGLDDPDGTGRLVAIDTPGGTERLWLRSFDVAPGAVAALALRCVPLAASPHPPAGAVAPAKVPA